MDAWPGERGLSMFLALSKTLDLAAAPLTWALLLALAGALAARTHPRRAAILAGSAAAVLYLFSVEPVANRLMRRVEASAVSTQRAGVVYDALVLLSGEVDAPAARASGRLELSAAADRLATAYTLLREGRARSILLTGGSVHPEPGERAEAELVAETLRAWGVQADRIVVEPASRNTHENAVFSAAIVSSHGWRSLLLVTSAAHLPRALAAFRRAGMSPDALPVDWRAGDGRGESWLPRADALKQSTDALRELVGRIAYWVAGYAG